MTIKNVTYIICSRCNGDKYILNKRGKLTRCPKCGGLGNIKIESKVERGEIDTDLENARTLKGDNTE